MIKQFYSFTILILAILLPATGDAYNFEVDCIYYDVNGNGASVTYKDSNHNSYSGDVTIPATINHNGATYSVTSIGDSAFHGCNGLTSIIIPNSVTTIGKYAFALCNELTSVTIGSSVYSIGFSAFRECHKLTSLTCLASKPPTDNVSFLSDVGHPATLYVPVESIEAYQTTNPWSSFHQIVGIPVTGDFEVDGIYYRALTDSTAMIIQYPDWESNYEGDVSIPASVTYGGTTYSIKSIGGCAFFYSYVTSVDIPNSVISIGNEAFVGCSELTNFTIPNSVTTMGDYAFGGCTGLTSITIPNSVTAIGSQAFTGCSALTTITIPNSVTAIENSVFSDCIGLANIDIPNSVTTIGEYAFLGCTSLTSITIPNSVTTIGGSAFGGCSELTDLTLGSGVVTIGAKAFNYCNALEKVTCLGTVPPMMENSNCFSPAAYRRAVLKVPRLFIDAYTVSDYWYEFERIVGYGSAGKGDVNADGIINILDVTTMINILLAHSGAYNADGDLNYNGMIDIDDITRLIINLLSGFYD